MPVLVPKEENGTEDRDGNESETSIDEGHHSLEDRHRPLEDRLHLLEGGDEVDDGDLQARQKACDEQDDVQILQSHVGIAGGVSGRHPLKLSLLLCERQGKRKWIRDGRVEEKEGA